VLRGVMYIYHYPLIMRDGYKTLGGFLAEFEGGGRDYDLPLAIPMVTPMVVANRYYRPLNRLRELCHAGT
jgi:hypothetical protein